MPEEEKIKLLQQAADIAQDVASKLDELYFKHCKAVEEKG